ncbi:hypothetical protein Hanom_Chr08g00716711 [Helianthus anomalus]
MLVFWIITRLTFDLFMFLKDVISSFFPLNSTNSPNKCLLLFSSNLHEKYDKYKTRETSFDEKYHKK